MSSVSASHIVFFFLTYLQGICLQCHSQGHEGTRMVGWFHGLGRLLTNPNINIGYYLCEMFSNNKFMKNKRVMLENFKHRSTLWWFL